MKPIRRETKRRLSQAEWSPRLEELHVEQTEHVVGDDGGLDSQHVEMLRVGVCGCLRPAGAVCGVCGRIVCVDCVGRCHFCSVPLCGRDSVFPNGVSDRAIRACRECWAAHRRRRFFQGLGRALLSPFVRFDEESK